VEMLIEDGRSEVIVVTRGGGSKADLWAFMNEQLARYLAESPVPIVSAVGHEIDTSITDLVADVVAATPSVAANVVFPDGPALAQRVDQSVDDLAAGVQRQLTRARERLRDLQGRLRHPRTAITQKRARCRDLQIRANTAFLHTLRRRRDRHASLTSRQARGMASWLVHRRSAHEGLAARLTALSPQGVLERGFAVVRGPEGVLTHASGVSPGDLVEVRVAHGGFRAKVEDVEP
jgi:exodeoxyribonuclease VII large subunit